MAAISGELNNGESVFAQTVSGGAGAAGLVIGAVLLASFAPAIRQVRLHCGLIISVTPVTLTYVM